MHTRILGGDPISCPIEILEVRGINPDPTGVVNSVEISGRLTNGRTECEVVYVKLLSPETSSKETSVEEEGKFTATIDQVKIECGKSVKVAARCKDCDPVEGEFTVLCDKGARPLYVSYYDCTEWNSNVEVMNLQNHDANFIITLYRRNGSLVWQDTIKTGAHETKRIQLDRYAPRNEGLVIVGPEKDGDEFPSMLCITNAKVPSGLGQMATTELQRFVPFIRVP